MRDYTKYPVWIDSMNLATHVYKITSSFPSQERFGLISQLRRAVVSISSNIAEGSSRSSEKDFSRFLEISLGSSFELKTQLMIAYRLSFVNDESYKKVILETDSISKQINGLRNKLKKVNG